MVSRPHVRLKSRYWMDRRLVVPAAFLGSFSVIFRQVHAHAGCAVCGTQPPGAHQAAQRVIERVSEKGIKQAQFAHV